MPHEFKGFEAPNVPPAAFDYSVKDGNCPANPDVIVDIQDEERWVRIPVTACELFINKDGPADITRTAKVEFPAEWGGQNISQFVNGFQAQNVDIQSYDRCRIFMRDQYQGTWQVVHYGYVGGVGPTDQNGVFKFWCYDAADLMKGIQVSKSWGEPTIAQVMDFVLNGVDQTGRDVGINRRSVFPTIKPYVTGIREVEVQKADTQDLGGADINFDGPEEAAIQVVGGGILGTLSGPLQVNIEDLADDIFDYIAGSEVTQGVLAGQKRFQLNRHNMVDLMNWFAAEVGAKWHFEPTPYGPILFFDNSSSRGIEQSDADITRRIFIEEDLLGGEGVNFGDEINPPEAGVNSPSSFTDKQVFSPVDTLENSALADIKPFNTLVLYGETTTPAGRRGGANYGASGSPAYYTEQYPYVELVYEPLLDRAGGYEYSAPPIESDKIYLDQARAHAIEEFRKHLAEETEGVITLKGEPHILPYDYIQTIPVCNDTFPLADTSPITYEVNSVKHTRSSGDRYKTDLRCSITFAEEDLSVTSEYREA